MLAATARVGASRTGTRLTPTELMYFLPGSTSAPPNVSEHALLLCAAREHGACGGLSLQVVDELVHMYGGWRCEAFDFVLRPVFYPAVCALYDEYMEGSGGGSWDRVLPKVSAAQLGIVGSARVFFYCA